MIVAGWRTATVDSVVPANPHARVLRLSVPGWPGNDPGQHVDIRLTAEDGYQAVRSYSLSSSGTDESIELAVDEVPDGEVSPYLVHDVMAGDELEVKGPLGGYFVWRGGDDRPVQLIAGGSGVVPLVGIARARFGASERSASAFRMLYSVRTAADALYRDELSSLASRGLDLTWAYTRTAPDGWDGAVGRLDDASIAASVWPPERRPVIYVCGPTGFVEHVADALVRAGHDATGIKTERFGGS
ncbi:MAG: ferredoxin reductase [Microbacterium sp.]|uniref:ferredoxin reductase n=1 Tax=Microbacterium sp. TaxID=51671 RepID=UPI001AD31A6E|nr:ferredoxin reductase [Microbacterium sp.]MBN9152629.1 ferredoxin reductase [Microbacterium sp.]MBN9172820.1 ferredoxin reductase [Microbacterium sp.]MBN9181061.1 ferredoxin reductase [Microbacterium sp.]